MVWGLSNKVALVTGGSRGIGKAISLAFADAGAAVALTYRQAKDAADQVVSQIRDAHGQALALQMDVRDRSGVRDAIAGVKRQFGSLDILVNNAGVLQQKDFLTISDNDWDRTFDVNLKGVFICTQEIFPIMQRQGGGRIINIASTGGQLGGPLAVHYAASKAGVICLTKSLARLGAPHILVNCLAPGLIETEMTKGEIASGPGQAKLKQILLERPGTAAEVAQAALFLASRENSYITGQTININGGLYLG